MTLEELAHAVRTVDEIHRKMIVICPVGLGLKVEALVLRYGMDDIWTVQESRRCKDTIYLINDLGCGTQ